MNREETFDFVLNEISKSALQTLGMDAEEEPLLIGVMGHFLLGLSSSENEAAIIGKASMYLMVSGRFLPEEEIKKMLAETREKCGRQVIGVITAYSDIEDFGCSAEDTLAHLHVQDFI